MTIANSAPMTGIHQGAVEGRFRPRIRPVTAAERSAMRTGCFVMRCQRYSNRTHEKMEMAITIAAERPK